MAGEACAYITSHFRLTDTDKYIVPLELYGSIVLLLRSDLSSGSHCRYLQQ
jgi:hypothetical protein